MIVRCEMCLSDIGTYDPGAVRAPLAGHMFGPLGPGFTPPFPPDAPFEGLLCPLCGRRAVGHDLERPEAFRTDRLLTPEGHFLAEPAVAAPTPARHARSSRGAAPAKDVAHA